LNAATAASAVNLGTADASKNFRDALNGSIIVDINLKADEISYLAKHTSFPLVFRGSTTTTTDHALLAAMRAVCRIGYEKSFKISTRPEKVLVIGSSAREMKLYQANPNIHHYIYGKEGKDVDRIVIPVLQSIMAELKRKVSKTNSSVFLEKNPDPTLMRPPVKRYFQLEQMLHDYTVLHEKPKVYHTKPVAANTLVFEDSIYNFDEDSLTKLFLDTEASIAYGYALLPMELLFPDMATNPIYRFWLSFDNINLMKQTAYLTFRNGYANGYSHDYACWSTLLKKPVLKGHGVALAVEIMARVGCMAIFKIYRCVHPETVVRTIELSEHECFVRVLDLWASVDHHSCKVRDLKYFSVKESEWYITYNYLMGMSAASMSFANTITFIRRCMGGASLVSKELLARWELTNADVYRLAIAATLQAFVMAEKTEKMFEFNNPTSIVERIKRVFGVVLRDALYPVFLLYELIVQENLTDKIVTYPVVYKFQRAHVNFKVESPTNILPIDLSPAFNNEEEIPNCPICRELQGKLGEQIVDCRHVDATEHVFKLTTEELEVLRTKLSDDDEDPPGLRDVKDRCKRNLPVAGFEHKCKIYHIRGGPGTGKSYIIRKLATQHDLVFAPFNKLGKDYKHLEGANGDNYDLFFQTTHRGVATAGGRERVFLDEWTNMDYCLLAVVAYKNQAKEVFLCGDERQTKLQEPDEGIYIGNRIDIPKISTHELLVNFRNPRDTVALLNRHFGYNMIAKSKVENSIIVLSDKEAPSGDMPALRMAISKKCAARYIQTKPEKCTVRANQGGSEKNVVLYLSELDGNLVTVQCLAIVAISRHMEKLYIVHDESNVSKKFLESLDINEEFKLHVQQFLQMPKMSTKAVQVANKDAEDLLHPYPSPGKDAYKLSSTLSNPIAFHPDVTSLNQDHKVLAADQFRTATSDRDCIFGAKINQRGNVRFMEMPYRAIGSGLGIHFENMNPFTEFAVFAERYDDATKPRFQLTPDARALVEDIVETYWAECKYSNHIQMIASMIEDDALVCAEADRFINDMKIKHYAEQFKGYDNMNIDVVRFHVKTIFKPENTVKDIKLDKCGQGIAAFNTDLSSFFCFCSRILQQADELTDRSDEEVRMISTLGKSEQEFTKQVTGHFKGFVDKMMPVQNGIIDAVKMDSLQDAVTQYAEYLYYKKLGASDLYLSWYFRFRKDRKLQGSFAKAKSRTEKNSGEPKTFFGNDVLTRLFGNYMLRGKGPQIFLHAGDDGDKIQMCLEVDEERHNEIKKHCSLDFTFKIREVGEFCGSIVTPQGCFPNLRRKHEKLIAKKFRDYDHFTEYQKTLRDVIRVVNALGLENTRAATMKNSKCSWEETGALWDAIVSWSHVNYEQYISETMVNSEAYRIARPSTDPTHKYKLAVEYMGAMAKKFIEWPRKQKEEERKKRREAIACEKFLQANLRFKKIEAHGAQVKPVIDKNVARLILLPPRVRGMGLG